MMMMMVQGTSCAKIASLWPMTTARATMGMTTQSAQARFPRRCVVIHRPRHFSISTHCGIIGNTSATKSGNKLFNAHSIIIARGSSFTMAEATRSFITHRMVDMTNESRLFSSESDGEAKLLEEVQDANERFSGNIQIHKKTDNQWGLFSARPFSKGSIVISSKLSAPSTITADDNDSSSSNNPKTSSCSHSIQINWNQHILMDLPARFLNHSCDPTVGVREGGLNEWGSYDFVALRNIDAGEEIRFDYETTEYEIGAFSECHCGASNCRGHIHGYKSNGDAIYVKYNGKNIAAYLTDDHGVRKE